MTTGKNAKRWKLGSKAKNRDVYNSINLILIIGQKQEFFHIAIKKAFVSYNAYYVCIPFKHL